MENKNTKTDLNVQATKNNMVLAEPNVVNLAGEKFSTDLPEGAIKHYVTKAGEKRFTVYDDRVTEWKKKWVQGEEGKKGFLTEVEEEISKTPFYPVDVVDAYGLTEDDVVQQTTLTFKTNRGEWQTERVFDSSLFNVSGRSGITALLDKGFSIPSKLRGRLSEIVYEMVRIDCDRGDIETRTASSIAGWQTDGSHLTPSDKRYGGTGQPVLSKKGQLDAWRSVARMAVFGDEEVEASPFVGAMMAYAISGFMRGFRDETEELDLTGLTDAELLNLSSRRRISTDHVPICHIHGTTSTGKTLLNRFISSLVGYPGKSEAHGNVIMDWSSTKVGIELKLSDANSMFVCGEEIHGATFASSSRMIEGLMHICNGGSRKKGGGSDGGYGISKFWDNVIISNGNKNIAIDMAHGQAEALSARLTQIDVEDHPIWNWNDSVLAKKLQSALEGSFGHAYDIIVSDIQANKQAYIERYHDLVDGLDSHVELGEEAMRRRHYTWLTVKAILPVLQNVLNASNIEMTTVEREIDYIIQNFVLTRDVSRSEEIRSEIVRFVTQNMSYFEWKGSKPLPPGKLTGELDLMIKQEVDEHNRNRVRSGKYYGLIDNDGFDNLTNFNDFIGHVYIAEEGVKAAALQGIEIPAVIKEAMRYGWGIKKDKTSNTVRLRVMGAYVRHYGFIIEPESVTDFKNTCRDAGYTEQEMRYVDIPGYNNKNISDDDEEDYEIPF